MIDLLKYGAKHCEIVILEGILYSDIYKPLFEAAVDIFKEDIYACYYDISFEETMVRHATKRNSFSFGKEEMRRWWREKDYIGFIEENRITSDCSLTEAVNKIYIDVKNSYGLISEFYGVKFMGLFNKHKEPIFLKENSAAETQLERLNKLKPLLNSERLAIIEQDIKYT